MNAIDRQLQSQFRARGRLVYLKKKVRDYAWRTRQLVMDLVPVFPLLLIALLLWYVSGRAPMDQFLKWVIGVLGGIATLGALLWSIMNAVRRLFVASPINAGASPRTTDPMADFQRRYSFLIRSAETPVAVVVSNLDRCRADYIVELLEGLQTLLKSSEGTMEPTPLVAVFVPAERRWLCESYVHVYDEFQQTAREPGRPFGLVFLDKVFDFALRLPVVPAAASIVEPGETSRELCTQVARANNELAIRSLVAQAENESFAKTELFQPLYDLRVSAVERLGWLEVQNNPRLCTDTARELSTLVDRVGAESSVIKQLRTAYCVQRTAQMLGGHRIDNRPDAILRLGIWTIMGIRWPLLVQQLALNPEDLALLFRRESPAGIDPDLASVFRAPDAASLATACNGVELTPDDVRLFSAPQTALERAPAQVPVPEFV